MEPPRPETFARQAIHPRPSLALAPSSLSTSPSKISPLSTSPLSSYFHNQRLDLGPDSPVHGNAGFDKNFPDEYPFWYGGPSGVRHMDQQTDFGSDDDTEATRFLDNESVRSLIYGGFQDEIKPKDFETEQRKSDSVLHYFVATETSESALDQYLTTIIHAFLNDPSRINASNLDSPETLQSKFGRISIPTVEDGNASKTIHNYLSSVKSNVIDKATRVSSSKMIGHMTTSLPYFHRPLARLLTALNQNVVKIETAATMSYLERETISMLHNEFYRLPKRFYETYMHSPDHCLGVFTSGGTIANITAIWAARNTALGPQAAPDGGVAFKGVDKEGIYKALQYYGYNGAVIVGSCLMHYSFKKAADLLGLGDEGLRLIPTDTDFRVNTDILKAVVEECIRSKVLIIAIVGIAGTTETGSIDDLNTIARISSKHSIHFHVDAAWGGPLVFSRDHQYKLNGIKLANTVTVDAHKQLYSPMGLGLLLFRSPSHAHSIRKTANYVIRNDSPDLGKFTLEGSRPANSLHLHASLHLLGRNGLESLTTRSVVLVRQLYGRLQTHPARCFQALHEPMTNILLYRYIPRELRDKISAIEAYRDSFLPLSETAASLEKVTLSRREQDAISEITKKIQTRQSHCGKAGFVSRTRVSIDHDGVNVMVDAFRVVIANPLTKWEDVDEIVCEQVKLGLELEEEMRKENALLEAKNNPRDWPGWPFEF
ncbi:pyridoxal phosphate-dependent transferase [Polychytrium aggregatum]|uniref:pyridoxal phosphate-dependent transferase n=1 Tax=Polychytrium aggregatum TaxID=110093 RepID=UPI0022FDEF86|nr:pyridoxal phosphate-dependent transferase [Polychytrium aggregatum]KAI9206005.1 pyridoxal phosphate-dependent transferase [Polychytrium aggregatum]